MKKENHKSNKSMVSFSVDETLKEKLNQIVEETGASKAEHARRAIKAYLDNNNEGSVMMNLILLQQKLQDVETDLKPEDYQAVQQYVNNILLIKGGKGHDCI